MRRSTSTIFRVVSGVTALVAMSVPMKPLLADTTLDSGTTTVSTGTTFGTNLYVADTGTATLVIAGGLATDTYGWIGNSAGSVGTATVSSGMWANSGDLFVGHSGTGMLTMSGGLVSVAGTLSKGAFGTISLNSGGTLQIGVGTTGGDLATDLINDGTLIFNRSDDFT